MSRNYCRNCGFGLGAGSLNYGRWCNECLKAMKKGFLTGLASTVTAIIAWILGRLL